MTSLIFNIPGAVDSKLEVTWVNKYKNLQLLLDGQVIYKENPSLKILKKGIHITTSEGHIIDLMYHQSWLWSFNNALEVTWGGLLLPNSSTKDNVKIKDAISCTGVIAIFGLISALFVVISSPSKLSTIILPVIYLILWLFIRKSNPIAMIIFAFIYLIETLSFLVNLIAGNYPSSMLILIPSMVIRLVILVLFVNAARSMNELKNKKKETMSTSAFDGQ